MLPSNVATLVTLCFFIVISPSRGLYMTLCRRNIKGKPIYLIAYYLLILRTTPNIIYLTLLN